MLLPRLLDVVAVQLNAKSGYLIRKLKETLFLLGYHLAHVLSWSHIGNAFRSGSATAFNYFEDIWTNAKKPITIKNHIKRKIEKFVDVLFTIDNMAMAPIRYAGSIGAIQQSKAAKKSGSLWKENF